MVDDPPDTSDAPLDPPLDPQVEAVRRRMVRLLAVGGAVMVLGFVALIVAVVYRLNAGDDSADGGSGAGRAGLASAPPISARIALPPGARVENTAVSRDRIALTLALPDGRRMIRVHDTAGRLVVQYDLE